MFIDEAQIYIKAGKGGDGAVSFRRERFVPRGGPDGGDGGDGGSVSLLVDNRCHGLAQFNREKSFSAENGDNGLGKNKHGKNGKDLVLRVPSGTQVYSDEGLLHDLVEEGKTIIIARGGNGGWGNQHFATSVKQAPKWSKSGLAGEEKTVRLLLKTIADVGLVGLPNAGKSTLLSVVSNARPKIADYPFTTLEPNLGTIKNIDKNIIIADIPGLIMGAHEGRGLGDKFLRHIERTKIILHLIDVMTDDVVDDYRIIRNELKKFSKELSKKPEIVVLTKSETVSAEELEKKVKALKKIKVKPLAISAIGHTKIEILITTILSQIL